MKVAKFRTREGETKVGLLSEHDAFLDLTEAGIGKLSDLLEHPDPAGECRKLSEKKLGRHNLKDVRLCPPVDQQEVWAAGVTYLRSKKARMEESDFSATAYDRVYEAERPEIFFKSMPEKVVAAGEAVGIRRDATWSVPEPELALVLNSRGVVAGYTIGNDMSSRDIEGENLLYLPQAKIYTRSCALGPWIELGATEEQARGWNISVSIIRKGESVFAGKTSVSQIKRRFEELAAFLFRSQEFPRGAVLLTGTGVVPPDSFTLAENDVIEIQVDGIGTLSNPVQKV